MVDDVLLELDGRKPFPIVHGACTDGELLQRSAQIVQSQFMAVNPSSLDFVLIALSRVAGGDDAAASGEAPAATSG